MIPGPAVPRKPRAERRRLNQRLRKAPATSPPGFRKEAAIAATVSAATVGASAAALFGPAALGMPNPEALALGGLSAVGLALAMAAWALDRQTSSRRKRNKPW